MKVSKQDRDEAIKMLRMFLSPGDTVWGIVTHVSSSGMSRRIKFYTANKERPADPIFLSGDMAKALGYPMHDDGGLKVPGCGIDMIFHCVYSLGRTLWPKGDGATVIGRNRDKSPETDGGYLLNSRQL